MAPGRRGMTCMPTIPTSGCKWCGGRGTSRRSRGRPEDGRPQTLWGGEVWRDLDWLTDEDKVALDVSGQENLQMALLGVFDSQICGGERYDLARRGRRKAA